MVDMDDTRDLFGRWSTATSPGGDFRLRPRARCWCAADGDGAFATPPPSAAGTIRAFARAAVLGQPGAYLTAVGRDLWRAVSPNAPFSPNPRIGNAGAGRPPGLLVSALQDPRWTANGERIYSGYYTVGYVHKDLGGLKTYERHTRLTGVLIVLVLLLALAAPALADDRRARLAGGLFAICGLALLIGPVLTNFFDWRYSIPAHGPIAAARGDRPQRPGRPRAGAPAHDLLDRSGAQAVSRAARARSPADE